MNVFVLHNILKGGCNNNNNNDSDCNSKCIREKKKIISRCFDEIKIHDYIPLKKDISG